MPHPNDEIRCPYCGGRTAKVDIEVEAAFVVEVATSIRLPRWSDAIHVSEDKEATCTACQQPSSFGAWLGLPLHMPADAPEPSYLMGDGY